MINFNAQIASINKSLTQSDLTRISIDSNADVTRDNLIPKSPDESRELTIENKNAVGLTKALEPPIVTNAVSKTD